MADRICSLCRQGYTDETGHNYNDCVVRCREEYYRAETGIGVAEVRFDSARKHLEEALEIQKHDWWKGRVKS